MQADISCQFATLSVQNALYFRTKIVQNSSLNSLYLHLQSERKIIIDDQLIFFKGYRSFIRRYAKTIPTASKAMFTNLNFSPVEFNVKNLRSK